MNLKNSIMEWFSNYGWILLVLVQLGLLVFFFLVGRALWIHFNLGNLI